MEQWKTCIYDDEVFDDYEVSNWGNVRSLKFGKIKILKPHDNGRGYLQAVLSKNGKTKLLYIHRLVACTWIPNPNGYSDVNHINENKHDNRVENLEWLSHKNNVVYSQAKQVICVETGQIYESCSEVERELGLADVSIGYCCNRKQKTCGGFHWLYLDDYEQLTNNEIQEIMNRRRKTTGKPVICVETGQIYESIQQASEELGITHGNIVKCCNGERKTCGGYSWKYVD